MKTSKRLNKIFKNYCNFYWAKYVQQKQSEIDELVDELTQIKLYGINDETLDKLIQKHK